jgi:hypothetical protein
MADLNRKPLLDRATALLAGPFLLGRRVLDLTLQSRQDAPPETPPEPGTRPAVTPPEHAIKRRG